MSKTETLVAEFTNALTRGDSRGIF